MSATIRIRFTQRGIIRDGARKVAVGRGTYAESGDPVTVSVDRETWEAMGLAFALGADAVYDAEVLPWRVLLSPRTEAQAREDLAYRNSRTPR